MTHSDRDRYSTLEVWNVDPQDKVSVPGDRATTLLMPGNRNGPGYSQEPATDAIRQKRRICGLSPKVFWAAVVVLALVILGAIAGGVAGGLANRGSDSDSEDTTLPEDPTLPEDETSSPSQMSAVYSKDGPFNNFHAVFYHKNGTIHIRWRDDSSTSWTEQNIEPHVFRPNGEPDTMNAKKNSPLSAVAVPSSKGGLLRLFYIDTSNNVRDVQCGVAGTKWTRGSMWESTGTRATSNTGLAAVAHYCGSPRCGNETLVVYQKLNGLLYWVWAEPEGRESIEIVAATTASPLAMFQAPPVNGSKMTQARLYYHSGEQLNELVFNQNVDWGWNVGKSNVMGDLPTSEKLPRIAASLPAVGATGLVLALRPSSGKLTTSWLPWNGMWNGAKGTPNQDLTAAFINDDAIEAEEKPVEDVAGFTLSNSHLLYARSRSDSKIRRYSWSESDPSQFTLAEVLDD